ncbi:MAG: methyltransferase type 11, partial [Bacteroidota bacterium]|nr:methyltransferase type 11 [Bacteroidota bacterium]
MHNEDNRRDWVKRQLEKLPVNARLLDAGAGEQQYKPFCAHLKYVSQDFAAYKPENMDSGLQMTSWDYGKLDIISDITSIPEADGSFDAI